MNPVMFSTLEHIALVKTCSMLWCEDDIRTLESEMCFDMPFMRILTRHHVCGQTGKKQCSTIECKIKTKIHNLFLPESLKLKLVNLIKPIGIEIAIWKRKHADLLSSIGLLDKCLKKLSWTPFGTIDKKLTAKQLVYDDNIEVCKRYELACIYCLESDILPLWKKLTKKERSAFFCEISHEHDKQHLLVLLWTVDIAGFIDKLSEWMLKHRPNSTPYLSGFKYGAMLGNKAATQFYLQKLSSDQAKEFLVYAAGLVAKKRCTKKHTSLIDFSKEYSEVLFYLLSQMTEEQKKELLQSNSYGVIRCVLDWPCQDFLLEISKYAWSYLSIQEYASLLYIIINYKIRLGYKDKDYSYIFSQFWEQSPITYRKCVIVVCTISGHWCVLQDLFRISDKENILLVLKDATAEEIEQIIYRGLDWRKLIYLAKWDLLKFFLQTYMPSKKALIKFTEEIKKRFQTLAIEKRLFIFLYFFNLLEELIEDFDSEDSSSNPVKKQRLSL